MMPMHLSFKTTKMGGVYRINECHTQRNVGLARILSVTVSISFIKIKLCQCHNTSKISRINCKFCMCIINAFKL